MNFFATPFIDDAILHILYNNSYETSVLISEENQIKIKESLLKVDLRTIPNSYYTKNFIEYLYTFDFFVERLSKQEKDYIATQFAIRNDKEAILWYIPYMNVNYPFYKGAIESNNILLVKWLYQNLPMRIGIYAFREIRSEIFEYAIMCGNQEICQYLKEIDEYLLSMEFVQNQLENCRLFMETNPKLYDWLRSIE
jgi:hypothetical protein